VLAGLNTYTGQTILKNGAINVAVLNNTGIAGNLGQHGTITTGLPALGADYGYRSFSLDGSIGILSKGFLRAKATAP
jgi:hypothetical protein